MPDKQKVQATETYSLPVLSTAHLTRSDIDLLNDPDTRAAAPFRIMEDEHGFFIHAGNVDDHEDLINSRNECLRENGFSAEFIKLIDSLRMSEFKYVLLDCDADPSEDLPVFDHG